MPHRELAALLDLLDDDTPGVSRAVNDRLRAMGDHALPALQLLAAGDDARRRVRARALERAILGAREADHLIAMLGGSDPGGTDRPESRRTLDLESLCLQHALVENPHLDVADVRATLNALARDVSDRLATAASPAERALALGAVINGTYGIKGNEREYYDPANSYLDLVLARRKAIPLTLAIVHILVGRRAGLDVFGIGLPRHFVVGFRSGSYETLIDAFHGGRLLDRAAIEAMLHGWGLPFTESLIAETPVRGMARRMFANLLFVYRSRNDAARVERTTRFVTAADDA